MPRRHRGIYRRAHPGTQRSPSRMDQTTPRETPTPSQSRSPSLSTNFPIAKTTMPARKTNPTKILCHPHRHCVDTHLCKHCTAPLHRCQPSTSTLVKHARSSNEEPSRARRRRSAEQDDRSTPATSQQPDRPPLDRQLRTPSQKRTTTDQPAPVDHQADKKPQRTESKNAPYGAQKKVRPCGPRPVPAQVQPPPKNGANGANGADHTHPRELYSHK